MTIISSFVALFLVVLFSVLVIGAFFYILGKTCFILQLRRSLYKLLQAENKIYRRAYWFKPKYFVFLPIVADTLTRLPIYFFLLLLCLIYLIRL